MTRNGASGVAWAFTIATVGLTIPSVAYCLRGSLLRWRDFAAIVWRPAIAAAAAGVVSHLARPVLAPLDPLLIQFLAEGVLFALVYVAAWLTLPGGIRVTLELKQALKSGFALDP